MDAENKGLAVRVEAVMAAQAAGEEFLTARCRDVVAQRGELSNFTVAAILRTADKVLADPGVVDLVAKHFFAAMDPLGRWDEQHPLTQEKCHRQAKELLLGLLGGESVRLSDSNADYTIVDMTLGTDGEPINGQTFHDLDMVDDYLRLAEIPELEVRMRTPAGPWQRVQP